MLKFLNFSKKRIYNFKYFCTSSHTLKIDEAFFEKSNEYNQAEFYLKNHRYRISQEFYQRILNGLERCQQTTTDNYIYILKK